MGNKRFCKKCQENGSLGKHLYSQRNLSHICSFSQRDINTACDRSNALLTIWAILASYRFNQTHETIEQKDDGLFNECLMDYNFIMDENKRTKVHNKTRRRKKIKSYWTRKSDKKENRKY